MNACCRSSSIAPPSTHQAGVTRSSYSTLPAPCSGTACGPEPPVRHDQPLAFHWLRHRPLDSRFRLTDAGSMDRDPGGSLAIDPRPCCPQATASARQPPETLAAALPSGLVIVA